MLRVWLGLGLVRDRLSARAHQAVGTSVHGHIDPWEHRYVGTSMRTRENGSQHHVEFVCVCVGGGGSCVYLCITYL